MLTHDIRILIGLWVTLQALSPGTKVIIAERMIQDLTNIPRHVAIIMDGNGRWAKERGKPRIFGHRYGAKRVKAILEVAEDLGIEAISLFGFSEENWDRPQREIGTIFRLVNLNLLRERAGLIARNARFRTMGDLSKLPTSTQKILKDTETLTAMNTGLIVNLAISYSSRTELVQACRDIAVQAVSGNLDPSLITAETIEDRLQTKGLPDPDLLIRTSGELRISNFLLWQIAYAEFYFSPVFWPDFSTDHFLEAVRDYQRRQRRYGRVLDPTFASRNSRRSIALGSGPEVQN